MGKADGNGLSSNSMDFPPQFYTIRAARARTQNTSVLGNAYGFERTECCGERRDDGFKVDGDARCYGAMNFHRTDVKRNVSASVTVELGCLACDTQHSFRDSINAGTPLVAFLTDQAFPPILPAKDNKCVVVVRVEDGLLSEIENSFKDIFAEFVRPNGFLPTGSVVLLGSVSHMGAKGIDAYAGSLVSCMSSLGALVGAGTEIIPTVPVPISGIRGGGGGVFKK
jgi:hypothetical protein